MPANHRVLTLDEFLACISTEIKYNRVDERTFDHNARLRQSLKNSQMPLFTHPIDVMLFLSELKQAAHPLTPSID